MELEMVQREKKKFTGHVHYNSLCIRPDTEWGSIVQEVFNSLHPAEDENMQEEEEESSE